MASHENGRQMTLIKDSYDNNQNISLLFRDDAVACYTLLLNYIFPAGHKN
jgi:hypothetical protein